MQNAKARSPASRFTHHPSSVAALRRVDASRITFHVSRFTHHASRFHAPPLRTPRSALRTPERGVALVITLVLLSVITFMAVTFLVVSRSQHGSVTTETDQAIARLAADTARERAIAELLAPILASTNEFNYGLLVSTNYINSGGFIQRAVAAPSTSITITPMAAPAQPPLTACRTSPTCSMTPARRSSSSPTASLPTPTTSASTST